MRHLGTALPALPALLLAAASHSALALDCPAGSQPYAERCVTQKMADYISCVEASGGNKDSITEEMSQVDGKKSGTAVKASGSTVAGKASGAVVLDRNSESALVKRLEKRWFSGSMSECAKAMTLRTTSEVNQHTDSTVKTAVSKAVSTLKASNLVAELSVDKYTGASVMIGNQGQGIVLVSGITLNWDFRPCPRLTEVLAGAPLVTYKYDVTLTQAKGSKLLDTQDFKYGPGDIDRFLVDLHYPGHGIYSVWFSFKHKAPGEADFRTYTTAQAENSVCEG